MATVNDVAAFILQEMGPLSAMKLQKLVYYSQAWHAVWSERPLFNNRIEAWANGPVVPSLYDQHKGMFSIEPGQIPGNPSTLSADERDSIVRVLNAYGDKSPQWLSDLTHMETPWQAARGALAPGERGNQEITLASMAEYYGGL